MSIEQRCFHLEDPEDAKAFFDILPSLAKAPECLNPVPIERARSKCSAELSLKAEDFIRFGQGHRSLDKSSDDPADLLPLTQMSVRWENERAVIVDEGEVLIPASAIKGAIAHRLDFHCRRLTGEFASEETMPEIEDQPQGARKDASELVKAFLGYAVQGKEAIGRAGHLVIDDSLEPAPKVATLTHNSIDRFSQGVRQGALYGEEMLYELDFKIRLTILQPEKFAKSTLQDAFRATLHDLMNGRLALGAGQSNGHGFVLGSVDESAMVDKDWFGGR